MLILFLTLAGLFPVFFTLLLLQVQKETYLESGLKEMAWDILVQLVPP